MKIDCPLCGTRDSREFSYRGDATYLNRPAADAGAEAWDDYLHNRDNPADRTDDLWHHGMGCGAWVVVTRSPASHEIFATRLAKGTGA